MSIQDTVWEVKEVFKPCGLQVKDSLDFEAPGSDIKLNNANSWGTLNQYHEGGKAADVTYGNQSYRLKIDGDLLTCTPSNIPLNPIVNPWSSGGLENGGVKLLPWMVSVAGGILAGVILGIGLGISPAAAFLIATVAAVGAVLIYRFANFSSVQDPPPSWTAQAGGTGQPPGGPPPYGPRIPRETDASRPA